jgi:2-oxoglutarate ferredoxin oxidoreductase subunit gamma
MEKKLFMGGIGGQGVVFGGKLMGTAAVEAGRYATVYASYSPAMRNGFTYSTVIVSEKPVEAPITSFYDCMAFFDEESCVLESEALKPGGVYIINSSLVRSKPKVRDARLYALNANHMAMERGDLRMLNIVMMGAIIEGSGIIEAGWLKMQIEKLFQAKPSVAAANIAAMEAGVVAVRGL